MSYEKARADFTATFNDRMPDGGATPDLLRTHILTVTDRLRERVLRPEDFGEVGTADDTATVQAWLDALRDGGIGHWGDRRYKVRRGLILQPSSGAVTTDGPRLVGRATLVVIGPDPDLPVLRVWNANYIGTGAARYYRDLDLGSITIEDPAAGRGARSNGHGVSLRGLWGARWGMITATGLPGSVVHVPGATINGNPDFYEVGYCRGDILAIRCQGYALMSENPAAGAGITGAVSAYDCWGGASIPSAQGTGLSGGSITGHSSPPAPVPTPAIDLGPISGAGNRVHASKPEIDAPKYGVLLSAITDTTIERSRIVFRRIGSEVWPLYGFKIGAGSTAGALRDAVRDVTIEATCRIEPGVTKDKLTIVDLTGAYNVGGLNLRLSINDNANIGPFGLDDIVKNIRPGVAARIVVNGMLLLDNLSETERSLRVMAAQATATALAMGGIGSAAGRVAFPAVRADMARCWSSDDSCYVVRSPGLYRATARLTVAPTAPPPSARVRMAFVRDRAGVQSLLSIEHMPLIGDGPRTLVHDIVTDQSLAAGDRVYLTADANIAVSTTTMLAFALDNTLLIERV